MNDAISMRDAEHKLESLCEENGVVYDVTLNTWPPRMVLRPNPEFEYQTCLFPENGGDVDFSEDAFAVMVVNAATGKVSTMFSGRFVLTEEFQRKAAKLFIEMRQANLELTFRNKMQAEGKTWNVYELYREVDEDDLPYIYGADFDDVRDREGKKGTA